MTVTFSPALLDPLVLAADDEEPLSSVWHAVLAPGGDVAWEQAVERRRRIDDLAGLVRGRAWLGALLLSARRLSRRQGNRFPAPCLEAQVSPHVLAATLGPEEQARLAVPWGRIERHVATAGARVRLHFETSPGPVTFFFARAGEAGPLPSAEWELLSGEGPVLLVACVGAAGATSLEEALEQATAVAGIVLSEQ